MSRMKGAYVPVNKRTKKAQKELNATNRVGAYARGGSWAHKSAKDYNRVEAKISLKKSLREEE